MRSDWRAGWRGSWGASWRSGLRANTAQGEMQDFLQVARQSFLQMQAAWDRADLQSLGVLATEPLLEALECDLQEVLHLALLGVGAQIRTPT